MVDQRLIRLLILVGLLSVLAILFVDYSVNFEAHDPYPTDDQLRSDYNAHVGEYVHFWMIVSEVDDGSFVAHQEEVELTIVGTIPSVQRGDVIQVYGRLEPGHVVRPERVVVSNQRNRTYMFVVSALAILLTGVRFVRDWTVEPDALWLTGRSR